MRGVVPAIVSNLDDPDKLGRMKVTFPWLGDKAESPLGPRRRCRAPATSAGCVVLPEVGDEVLVAFDHGDPRLPYVIGGLYNGKDKLPGRTRSTAARSSSGCIVSRNGHRVELDDKDDVITIATGDGKHRIVLDQKGSKIVLETTGDVEVTSKAKLTVNAADGLKLESTRRVRAQGQRRDDRRRRRGVQRQGRRRPRSRAAARPRSRAADRRRSAARS